MVGYIFGGETGDTPESLKRKRDIAAAMMARSSSPKNVGEGLSAIGNAIIYRSMMGDIEGKEAAGRKSADDAFAPIASLLGGGSMPSPGAAGEMSANAPSFDGKPVTAKGDVADYIRQSATSRGIDPDIALRVALSEGGVDDPVRQSLVVKNGVREPSYGPFQLYMGGGLGNKALSAGIDPRDPSQWKQGVDFALDQAKTGGWGPWYGAKKLGITGMMGIGSPTASAAPANVVPNEVASLDPSAGVPMPGASGQMRASDPSQPIQQAPAPPLPPPTTVADAPKVAAATPVQGTTQVAQAMMSQPAVDIGAVSKVLSNPFLSPGQRAVAESILKQEMDRRSVLYERQLQQSDPKYQLDLQKGQIELQNLREPKISPADQQRIALEKDKLNFERTGISAADQAKMDMDKQRLQFEQNKPVEVNGRLVRPDGTIAYEGGLSAEQDARLKLDREKFDAEVKKGQWQKMTDGRLYNQTTGEFKDAPPPVPGSVPPKMDDISGMRKEIQQLPSYKNLAAAAPIYKAMAETAGRNSKASDLNLVYGLGKIMDPTSVVREGEMIMVKNTASLPDWLQGAIASLNGGAALTPETRQAIMTEAYGRVKGYNDEFQQNMGQYQGIVQRNGINPADVIPEVDTFEPWKMPEAPAAEQGGNEPVPEGMDPEIWKFVPPEDRKLWRK